MGGDAEMREDRPDDQRSQQHLDDNTTEVAEHPVPAAEKPLIPRRMTEPMLTRSMLRTIRKPAPEGSVQIANNQSSRRQRDGIWLGCGVIAGLEQPSRRAP